MLLTPTATIRAARGSHEPVARFIEAPAVKVSREHTIGVRNKRHATKTAPDKARSDKESLHTADERESLLTLPDAVREPAPLSVAAPEQAAPQEAAPATRTGRGQKQTNPGPATQTGRRQDKHPRREQNFAVCVDLEQIIVCGRDLDALPPQTGRRQEKHSRQERNFRRLRRPGPDCRCRRDIDALPTQTGRRQEMHFPPGAELRRLRRSAPGYCLPAGC